MRHRKLKTPRMNIRISELMWVHKELTGRAIDHDKEFHSDASKLLAEFGEPAIRKALERFDSKVYLAGGYPGL